MSSNTSRTPTLDRSPVSTRPIHVLHVDDDRAFTELTAEFLPHEDDRFVVSSSFSGADALDRLDAAPVDCVVSDFEMPGMNGLAFLRRVREHRPGLPFVLFTGNGSEEVAAEAIATGVSDYLQKGGSDRYALLATRLTTLVEKYWTEEELAAVQRRYALVGSVTADAFFEWNVQTDAVWRNDGYARVFGYDEDAVGEDFDWWADRLHPDDRDRVTATLNETLRAGDERYEDRFRFRFGDGSYGHVSARAHVAYVDGEPTTVTGSLTDLTDYVEQERELVRTDTRLELALEETNTGVWEWDIETDEVTWDRTTEQLFGVPEGEFDGTFATVLENVHPEDVSLLRAALDRAFETDGMYEVDHRLPPDATGSVRWISGNGVVIRRDGVPVRMVGIVRDVTERYESQLELQRQNDRLNEFTSVVSHDLRGPLSVAAGHLEFVEPADDASRDHLATVERAHDNMGRLLEDLLSLSQQGETIADPAPVSLADVAAAAWAMVDTGNATLTVDDAVVMADERRLEQVFQNLFRNAVQHGSTAPHSPARAGRVDHGSTGDQRAADAVGHDPDGAVSLSVTVGPVRGEPGRGSNGFFVGDDGLGIPRERREAVFEPGFTTSTTGTGFGLSIVHGIAVAHGWTVSVDDGGGARFVFEGVELVRSDES